LAPEYSFVKRKRFFTPDPSSSARPISLNTRAITGFFGKGVKFVADKIYPADVLQQIL